MHCWITSQKEVVACDAEGNLVLFNQMAREWHGIDAAALPAEEWASHFDLYCGDGKNPAANRNSFHFGGHFSEKTCMMPAWL